jgi:hypothetical protein
VRTVDHTAQLDRVDLEIRRNLRLLRVAEWLHRIGNAALVLAGVAVVISTQELLREPTPSGAIALTVELIVVELDLVAHLIGFYLRNEVDDHAARLRHELDLKGDDLRQSAIALGLDWQRFLPW